ncbi:UNVERIFIED_CONTAM: hypothetical protein RMT77_011534 [Armadillidium vulgare]
MDEDSEVSSVLLQGRPKFDINGHLDKSYGDSMDIPFGEVTEQVLSEDPDTDRGYTSYDLISRTLHQLARDGNHRLLAMALDRLGDQCGRRIDSLDDQQMAPLHYAARYSHPYTILTLLQKKAKVNIRGHNDVTPLHCAARYRKSIHSAKRKKQKAKRRKKKSREESLTVVNAEDEETERNGRNKEDKKEENKEGGDAEEEERKKTKEEGRNTEGASDHDDDESEGVIKVLVENGADVHARDIYGLTPLHYAAMRGHDVAARDLLEFGHVDTEARDKQQMTPLFIAATYGYVDICRRLIDNSADIIAMDESQQTPLHRAAAEGHNEILEMLLEAAESQGGNLKVEKLLSIKDIERLTPFHLAVMNGNIETARLLLKKGAEVNTSRDTLATPLHSAAVSGDIALVKLLLENGANIEAVDCNQQSALHKAAANNQGEVILTLIENGANIEKKDKDSFTPLLLASSSGNTDAVSVLLDKGALVDVIDKDDKTPVYWCAHQGHLNCLKVLLENEEAVNLIDFSDRFDNSPLHEAARNGYLDVVKLLLEKGSQIDNKNEDEETALHIAAETGQKEVVEELIKNYRFLINDENEDGDSPLHLASSNGRTEVVQVLLQASADVEARNTLLWTPLDCASANGHLDVCKLLIENNAPLDPLDKTKTTPLQLAAQNGHTEVIKLLIEKGASVAATDSTFRNALEIATAAGQKDAAIIIVRSSQWLEALRNVRYDNETGRRITPFRLLIQRFPEVAKIILDRCMTTNGRETEDIDYGIKFNFEFVDDTYVMNETVEAPAETAPLLTSTSAYEDPFDEYGRLYEQAEPYTTEPRLLKSNHPLMLMVKYSRTGLLGHPVSVSLLKHKWLSYARFVYYFNLIFYIVFLSFLTAYVCIAIDWRYAEILIKKQNISITSSGITCKEVDEFLNLGNEKFLPVAQWIIIVMTILNIVREIFQIYQARLQYLRFENFAEWLCYIGALLLVIDFTGDSQCSVREVWQWQLGAVVIFLAWLTLVLFFRKLPLFGIYVVMFTDVFITFIHFFVVFFLFIVGFALSFFMIFRSQLPFEYVGKSLLKTSVMMIGEFEFDTIFNNVDNNGQVTYPFVSYLLFIFFLILMSILVMNLLIGLAVDDIKAVQDQAVLKRRAMQTQLILDVEVLIPESLRRYFATSFRKLYPNRRRSPWQKMFSDFNLLHNFNYASVNDLNGSKEELVQSLNDMKQELSELKLQNQKMYALFSTTLMFHKRMKRMEKELLEGSDK